MYARSLKVRGNPGSVDEAVAYVRDDVAWRVQQMPGCAGLSMLADRETGRCIITTAWETAEARQDSSSPTADLRRRVAEILGGEPELAQWEIAVLHRRRHADTGACTRVTWGRIDPGRVDDLVEHVRASLVPRLEQVPGFASVSLLVDRARGLAATAATYESRSALERSRDTGSALREEVAARLGMEITEVAEFDLVLAHLRVPETV